MFHGAGAMFTVEYRTQVRETLIEKARNDARIESAAAVGGSAEGEPDRWSDLDLTFGVVPAVSRDEVVEDWTRDIKDDFDAVTLFDLPVGSSIYRVFLLPGALQVDLSFTPGSEFGVLGPRFALLFGSAVERKGPPPVSPREEFGLAAHHIVRARYCLDRGRLWQAEYWTSLARDHVLTLACRRLGLETAYGRGFDELPAEIRDEALASVVHQIERDEILRALRHTLQLLLHQSDGVHEEAQRIESMLRETLE